MLELDYKIKTAEKMKIKVNLVDMKDIEEIQNVPSAFGTFSIVKDGDVISHNPISNTRFENIMKSKK